MKKGELKEKLEGHRVIDKAWIKYLKEELRRIGKTIKKKGGAR